MKRYEIEKESFKAYVTSWQDQCMASPPTFSEINWAWEHFHKRGKRLGLTRWLEDQGIPKPVRVEVLENIEKKHENVI